MNDLKKSLERIGFTAKKAGIYLALLELGDATVIEIAKKAGLKRTTVYNILPELVRDGLVTSGSHQKKTVFFVEDVRNIKRELEEHGRAVTQLLPELRAIHNIIPYKPRITYYEGTGGMKELYQDTLDSLKSGDTILSYTGLSNFYQLMPQEYARWYIGERVRRKIIIRVIAPESDTSREWMQKAREELREIKMIKSAFRFNADTEIYAHKVALISYRENFLGVIIESKEIAEMQRSAFEVMWNSL